MTQPNQIPHRWRTSSLALIVSFWAILQIGGLFTPGLLDDVDSIYIQIAREMLQRHDFVTPTIDGIRFFDKPPLLYWMAAGSMRLFGIHDWAARLPLALGVLALLLAVYALGIRFYSGAARVSSAQALHTAETKLSPSAQDQQDRAGLYAALAMATCIGPYIYTRFYIPDILIALWMTLAVHLFLIALDRAKANPAGTKLSPSAQDPGAPSVRALADGWDANLPSSAKNPLHDPVTPSAARSNKDSVILSEAQSAQPKDPETLYSATTARPFLTTDSVLLPMLGFAAVTALNLLTKGLIGVVFPIAFAILYLAFTHQLDLLRKLHLLPSILLFLAIAAPWHLLAAIRNPPIPMPPGLGLPTHAGWAWFYLYNEHIARFLGHRIPHDYGQVPIPIFWALLLLWLFPWVAFLPAALRDAIRTLRHPKPTSTTVRFDSDPDVSPASFSPPLSKLSPSAQDPGAPSSRPPLGAKVGSHKLGAPSVRAFADEWDDDAPAVPNHQKEAALSCLLWAGIILGFFTLSSRQEYYHLPALPALALLVGGFLASEDARLKSRNRQHSHDQTLAVRVAPGRAALYFLTPIGTLLFLLCGYLALTAHAPTPNTTLSDVLRSNPNLYNLSLGHLFDLTGPAMGFFRGPLLAVALGMLTLGPIAYLVRKRNAFAANLLIAAAMTAILLAAHEGLVRFYPILGSKDLALAIDRDLRPGDILLNDGELTSGSALLFYTPKTAAPILLVNGRVNGPWFGSFYPDAPKIFLNDTQLAHLWAGPHRLFLLTDHPEARTVTLSPFAPVHILATAGDKTILTNR